jgi:hypothetical protein
MFLHELQTNKTIRVCLKSIDDLYNNQQFEHENMSDKSIQKNMKPNNMDADVT